jgi:hypothetical protein
MTQKKAANYIGALCIVVVPILYNVAMHKIGMHGADFGPWVHVALVVLAVVVAFTDEIKRILKGLVFKVSKAGIEVDGDNE